MAAISIPVASACISALFLAVTLPAQTSDQAVSASQLSKVRIVRLSEVRGAVQLDRNTGRGYEPAFANLPIVEKSRLQTNIGIAEVEFEDNSTLRVGPNSIVEFPELDRLPDGATVSSVRLVKGTAYVSLLKTRGNQFNLQFGRQKLQLPPSSHVRLQIDGPVATLAVLDGKVQINGADGPTDVPKKNTITFHLQDQTEPTLAKNVVPEGLDSWDKTAAQSHAQIGHTGAFNSPYAYGLADLMYYGSFVDIGGCGPMWRPYFASAAWDPFSNGVWAWYQGAGYSWVSPYPWGWTPYHFGSWSYCAGAGWGWRPGGSWNGLNNATVVPGSGRTSNGGTTSTGGPTRGPARPVGPPAHPVGPPAPGAPTLTVRNLKPIVRSEVTANTFVFRKDSAGLGVPREGLGKLNRLSQDTLARGTATMPIYLTAPAPPSGNRRSENGAMAATGRNVVPVSVHRGSPPASDIRMPSQASASNRGTGTSSATSGSSPVYQPSRSMVEPGSQSASRAQPMPSSPPPMQSSPPPMQSSPPPMQSSQPSYSPPPSAPSGGGPAPTSSSSRGR